MVETNERQLRANNDSHEELAVMKEEMLSLTALATTLRDEIVGLHSKLRASQQHCTELETLNGNHTAVAAEMCALQGRFDDGAAEWLAREQDLREELLALTQYKHSAETLQQELVVRCSESA